MVSMFFDLAYWYSDGYIYHASPVRLYLPCSGVAEQSHVRVGGEPRSAFWTVVRSRSTYITLKYTNNYPKLHSNTPRT